jgi:hypothetical protein
MSIYTEFAEDIRARQERVARRQAWFRLRRRLHGIGVRLDYRRLDLLLAGLILLVIALAGAIVLVMRMH